MDASQTQLRAQLETLNDQLVDAGAKNAEDAFSLGCWMSVFVVVVAGILAFLLSGRSLIVTAIVVTGLTLVATVLATFLSVQAKAGAMRRAYGELIEPQLSELRGVHQLGRQEFLALALQELPEDSPLHRFLTPTGQQEAVLPTGQTGVNG